MKRGKRPLLMLCLLLAPAGMAQEVGAGAARPQLDPLLAAADSALEAAGKNGEFPGIPALEAEWAGKLERFLEENPGAERPERAYLRLVTWYGSAGDAGAKIRKLYDRIKAGGAGAPWFEEFLVRAFYQLHGKDPKVLLEMLTDAEAAASRNDTKVSVIYYQGKTLMASGDLKEARARFDRILEEYGGSPFEARASGNIHEIDRLQPGMPAPDFKIPLVAGGELTLSSLKGKVVLLVFWTHWAPLMQDKAPLLVKLLQQHASKPFALVGVSLDEAGRLEDLKKSIARLGLAFPQGFDGQGWESPVAKSYNVQAVPRAFLIDPEGRLLFTDLLFQGDFEDRVRDAVVKRDVEIQKQIAEEKKAEEEKKKAAEAAKQAAEKK